MFKFVFLQADTKEELDLIRQALQSVGGDSESIDLSDDAIKKTKKAEYNKRYYNSKKNSEMKITENVLNSEQIQQNSEILRTESEKEEEKEEKDFPLSFPCSLSSSPCTPNNNPITPYIPLFRKEEREEEKDLETAVAEPLNAVEPVIQKPKKAKRSVKKVQDVPNLLSEVPKKPKLTPNDDAFWDFAKEEKDRARAFYDVTGLYPVGREFGRWLQDLRQFSEAGVSIDAMISAVEKQKREGITIFAPGSVYKTARSLQTLPQTVRHEESWTERASRIESQMMNSFGLDSLLGRSEPNGEVIDV